MNKDRINWIDCAKGISIILVVIMHSGLGIELVGGTPDWMNRVILMLQPVRMPLFFTLSGLFFAKALTSSWRDIINSKLLHFTYFYAIWLVIQSALRSSGNIGSFTEYFLSNIIEPTTTLWFIYMLGLFFAITRLMAWFNAVTIIILAATLNLASISVGALLIDKFALYWVYFVVGVYAAPFILIGAKRYATRPASSIIWLCIFIVLANVAIELGMIRTGKHIDSTFLLQYVNSTSRMLLSWVGVGAFIAVISAYSHRYANTFLHYCGQNSLQIFLAFFLFKTPFQHILKAIGLVQFAPNISLILLACISILGPLYMNHIIMNWRPARYIQFLFVRPKWVRLPMRKPDGSTTYAPAK